MPNKISLLNVDPVKKLSCHVLRAPIFVSDSCSLKRDSLQSSVCDIYFFMRLTSKVKPWWIYMCT